MLDHWGGVAEIRRNQIEAGLDITFSDVFIPIFVRMIEQYHPKKVLEVGAGTGHLALEICPRVGDLTAIEPSFGMYQVAVGVLSRSNVQLFQAEINELPESERYDMVYSHLVAHCVSDFAELLRAVFARLSRDGVFVFSIPHPCFFNEYKKLFGADYRYMSPISGNISFSITKDPAREISDVPYCHRPLSFYINEIISSGLVLGRFEEVVPSNEIERKYGSPWLTPRYCMFVCARP